MEQKQSIFKRFIEILKPDFLVKNIEEIQSSRTWKFWFLSNSLAALIISIFVVSGLVIGVNGFVKMASEKYPDAKVTLENGKLTTEGLNEPVHIPSKEDKSVFVIDTEGKQYNPSVLDEFDSGVFITKDKIYSKENNVKTEQVDLSKITQSFSISTNDLPNYKNFLVSIASVFLIFAIWIYLNVFRLASAFWWALVFWILALIMQVKQMTYMKTYHAVLNFYIVPLAVVFMVNIFVKQTPFLTFGILLIMFLLNYRELKKITPKEENLSQDSK